MKKLGLIFLLALTMPSFGQDTEMNTSESLARSTGGGNGGFIEQMREAQRLASHDLSASELREILELDGKEIKAELILPLVKTVSSNEIEDTKVAEMWKTMKEAEVELSENVQYTRMEEGTCPNGEDLCTDDAPYSTIYFDVEQLVQNKTSLAELAGMVIHEYGHHYLGQADHPYYSLANWFKNHVAKGNYRQRTFTLMEVIRQIEQGGNEYAAIEAAQGGSSFEALKFCRMNGFQMLVGVKGNRASVLNRLDAKVRIVKKYLLQPTSVAENPYYIDYKGFHFIDRMNGKKVFTEITCK